MDNGKGPNSKALPLKPGEMLPSVLRTSADLGSGLSKLPPASGTAVAASATGKRAAGPSRVAPGELLGTSTLPRVDANSVAHHQALPARAVLSSSPQRLKHAADSTADRHRDIQAIPAVAGAAVNAVHATKQQPLCSSGDGPPACLAGAAGMPASAVAGQAACAASTAQLPLRVAGGPRQPGVCSSSLLRQADVPEVGSVAMPVLSAAWLAGSPPGQAAQQLAAGAARHAVAACSTADTVAAAAAASTADDLRLLRPVDPTNPSYYWKPLSGPDCKNKAAGSTLDSILGAQLLLDAGVADSTVCPVSHSRQRKSILLRAPLGSELFLSAVPAVIQDRAGHSCLLVLPSDRPSCRKEATAVEDMLAAMLQEPSTALHKACEWRAATLGALCAESLNVVAEAMKQRSGTSCWQFRQLTRNLTGKVLGASMAEIASSLIDSSQVNPAAAQLTQLINSREAAAQVAAAVQEVSIQAAAATAPAALRPLAGLNSHAAAAAVASLDDSVDTVTAAIQRHKLQQQSRQATPSMASRLPSSQSNRSSSACSLHPTAHSEHQQQLCDTQHAGLSSSSSYRVSASAGQVTESADVATAAACASSAASRRSTGTLGTYAALTIVTDAERASGSISNTHGGSPVSSSSGGINTAASAGVPGVGAASPGPRQSSAADGRSPSLLNPAARPASVGSADAQSQQLSTDAQLRQAPAPEQQQSSPGRSRLQGSSSRCSSPAPAFSPGTPQASAMTGLCSPAATPGSRASSSHAARDSVSLSRQQGQPPSPAAAGTACLSVDAAGSAGSLLHAGSRLASATGQCSPSSPKHSLLQPDDPPQGQQLDHLATTDAARNTSSAGDAAGARMGSQLSSLYGLSLSAAICMADLVRQVEVACVERGHALAYAWNCSMSAAEAVMVELRVQNQHLLGITNELAGEQEELVKELKAVDFLRREALRFRHAMEEAQEKLGQATDDNSRLRAELEAASKELAAVEAFARKRLARLRWRNAFAVLGTWSQQSLIQSGGLAADHGQVLPKVKMLEKMTHAVHTVECRKAAFRRQAQAQQDPHVQISDVAQVMTAGPRVAAPGHTHNMGYGSDNSAQMLTALTPEARTMVLASMPPAQRWQIMGAMHDEERAEVVVAMGLDLRKEAAAALDPRVWEKSIDIVKNSGTYAARYLKAWDSEDAAKEFLTWGTFQQLDCLASLDSYTAAAVLTRVPDALRKDLLGMLEPYVAANIVQAMLPPPAAAALEGLDMKKAMAIFIAMDPNKAADVLTEMGAPQAASKLILMDADARNSILESMAPRAAANTLTSMEDALQAAQEAGMTEPGSLEMLTLSGGPSLESPVMGAMSDLDPNNAYTIMSYMSIEDKAALLASMEPDAVARLLGCMDPHEAVLLLSAIGDSSSSLISNYLTCEDRDKLLEVLQAADCKSADSFANKARLKGSFRDAAAPDTVDRLMGAYEAIEAVAMDEDGEDDVVDATAPAATAGGTGRNRRSKQTASFNERQKQRSKDRSRNAGRHDPTRSVGVQVGAGLGAPAILAGAADPEAPSSTFGMSAGNTHHRSRTTSSIGCVATGGDQDGSDVDSAEAQSGGAATTGTDAAAKSSKAHAGPSKPQKLAAGAAGAVATGKKPGLAGATTGTSGAASAAAARERRLSSSSAVEYEVEGADSAAARHGAGAAATAGGTAGRHATAVAKTRRATRASDADGSGSGDRRGAAVTVAASPVPEDAVPPLQLGGRRSSHEDTGEDTPPGSSTHRTQHADVEHSMFSSDPEVMLSGGSTPRALGAAPAVKGAARAAGAATTSRNAAVARKALKEALKTQAAAKKVQGSHVGTVPTVSAVLSAGGAGSSSAGVPGRDGVPADHEADTSAGPSTGGVDSTTPPMEAPPQVKLGKVPKNARLIEAMAQHKNAKPKPKGWLMAVVESIYKEGETLLRKLGRADMIKKQSVPEIVFAYFHNKYGQRALVNENVGSLVNTLTLYQHTDLRLEAFARQLSEEWDVSIFLDFLIAQNLCLQPAKVACIEYPRDAGKDEQYPWVCLWKAVWVADNTLGTRAQAARDRFNEFLQLASMPADDADVERLRRERREAAAKDGIKGGDADLPEKFYKLPRIRFLLLLCKELLRINRFIIAFGEDRFTAMDVQRSGKVNIVAVRGFVKNVSPGVSDAQVSEHISTFVSTAEGAVRDVPPEQVSVPSVTELCREAFVAGVSSTTAVRDHIKLHLLTPARLEEENEEAQIFFSLLGVLVLRHSKALLPTWEEALTTAGQHGSNALQQQLAAVTATGTATDVRFKAYVGLLLGLINVSVQSYVDGLLNSEAQVDTLHSDQLEEGLVRLEDVAMILVCGCSYLLTEGSQAMAMARTLRLPMGAQIASMGKQLLAHRRMQDSMVMNAAAVLQRVWRARQQQQHLSRQEFDGQL